MKVQLATLTLIALSSLLTACGNAPVAQMAMPRMQTQRALTAQPQRNVVNQLVHAYEERGFSSIQNPMRTMMVEYKTADGRTIELQADRFLKHPEFQIQLRVSPNTGNKDQNKYFPSTDKAQVQALVNTLQSLNTQGVDPQHLAALTRIVDHLKSGL